jgi:hypothetical protein
MFLEPEPIFLMAVRGAKWVYDRIGFYGKKL